VQFRTLGIVGGGQMGKSIAEKLASRGIVVMVSEISPARAAARKLVRAGHLGRKSGRGFFVYASHALEGSAHPPAEEARLP